MARYLSQEFSAIVDKLLKVNEKTASQEEIDLKRYIRLVIAIAKPYVRTRVELEDLCSCGIIGILEARKSFDPSRSEDFRSYASMRIMGEIFAFCQKNSRLAHVQTHISKAAIYVEKMYKFIASGTVEDIRSQETEDIILNYHSKYTKLLPDNLQESIAYAKERVKNIAENSSLNYEDLIKLAKAALITTVPECVLEGHPDENLSVEDYVARKEIREALQRTLKDKTYRTLELSVQGYRNTDIAKILHKEDLTQKEKPVSRAAIKSLKDAAVSVIKNMKIFKDDS